MKRIAFDRVRMLVASPDGVLRERMRAIFEAFGARLIMEAHDGFEALDLFGTGSVDLVFADRTMPLIDGLELTRLIRLTECTGGETGNPYAPLIVLGDVPDREALRASLDAGVTEVLDRGSIGPARLYDLVAGVVADPRPFIQSAHYFGPDRRRARREPELSMPKVDIEETPLGPVTREAYATHAVLHAPNVLADRAMIEDESADTSREAAIARAEAALTTLQARSLDLLRTDVAYLEQALHLLEAGPGLATARDAVLDASITVQATAAARGFATAQRIARELCRLLEDVRLDAGSLKAIACHVDALRAVASGGGDGALADAMVEQLAQLSAEMRRRSSAALDRQAG
jgi:CheY-like chemotaxis protein